MTLEWGVKIFYTKQIEMGIVDLNISITYTENSSANRFLL